MDTATRTVTINAAFLQEVKQDNQDLRNFLDRARETLADAPPLQVPFKRLAELLELLRDQLALHFALEEAYGYFDDAIEVAPRLSMQANVLRAQHATLFLEICALVERSEQLLYRETAGDHLAQLIAQFAEFDGRLAEHESQENKLIFDAFDEDIGVGD